MRFLFLVSLLFFSRGIFASDFKQEASVLAQALKKSLMSEVKTQVRSKGVVGAIGFCHSNVKSVAKTAAGKYLDKYTFGRTSHKIRNPENSPKDWMIPYLEKFQKTSSKNAPSPMIHVFNDGKKAYLEPLYVKAMCLNCHGTKLSSPVSKEIKRLYPNDHATSFKVGDFRGILWIKEK